MPALKQRQTRTPSAEELAISAAISGAIGAVSGGLVAHQYPYSFLGPLNYHFSLDMLIGTVDTSTVEIGSVILGGIIGVALLYWAHGKQERQLAKAGADNDAVTLRNSTGGAGSASRRDGNELDPNFFDPEDHGTGHVCV